MAVDLVTRPEQESAVSPGIGPDDELRPAIRTILETARPEPRGSAKGVLAVVAAFAGLFFATFFPLDFGPLGWFVLAPLVPACVIARPTRKMYLTLYLGGLIAWVPTLQWMRIGDPSMIAAWLALAAYLAAYLPVTVFATRGLRRIGLPVVVALPAVWVAGEYARAQLLTGFSWYYLGHTQWRWTAVTQVADLVGAYGVSFVVAGVGAAAGLWLPASLYRRLGLAGGDLPEVSITARSRFGATAWALTLVAAAVGYGSWRTAGEPFEPGLRVGLAQGSYPTRLNGEGVDPGERYRTQHTLTGLTVPYRPDLVVWPETVVTWPLLTADPALSDAALRAVVPDIPPRAFADEGLRTILNDLATQAGAAMAIGLTAGDATPEGFRLYNSVAYTLPEAGLVGRYDKVHRVPFGEYIPLEKSLPWLQSFTPYRGDFGIDAGVGPVTFKVPVESRDQPVTASSLICFEDTVPHLATRFAREAPADVFLNLSNDGWFDHSPEQRQHLVTASFRAIETRTPLVRCSNTGISAAIDGNGRLREPVAVLNAAGEEMNYWADPSPGSLGRPRPQQDEHLAVVVDVPLDTRASFYVATGDYFAGGCGLFAACGLVAGVFTRRRPGGSTR
ncbi:MAG: apolipoprotein N-acyltransferase [Planctomycetota bacterium]